MHLYWHDLLTEGEIRSQKKGINLEYYALYALFWVKKRGISWIAYAPFLLRVHQKGEKWIVGKKVQRIEK